MNQGDQVDEGETWSGGYRIKPREIDGTSAQTWARLLASGSSGIVIREEGYIACPDVQPVSVYLRKWAE